MGSTKNRRRLMAVHLLVLTLLGCPASPSLDAGELGGPLDLKELLPSDVAASLAGADATKVHRDTVLVGPKCAPVEVEWLTVQSGQGQYLLSAKARLLKPVEYDSLTFTRLPGETYLGPKEARIQVLSFRLNWSKSGFWSTNDGITLVTVQADSDSIPDTKCP